MSDGRRDFTGRGKPWTPPPLVSQGGEPVAGTPMPDADPSLCEHVWGTDGAHSNEYCKKCFVSRPDADPPLTEAEARLRAWVRDYGNEKSPVFVADLWAVMNALDAARAEAARYRDLLNRTQAALRIRVTDGTDGDPVECCERLLRELDAARAEAARFKEEMYEAQNQADQTGHEIENVCNNNARLRAALEAMLSSPRFGNEPSEEAVNQAREALEGENL